MAVSKVILNGNTLIDTTDKTVTAGSMLSGITALQNDGTTATGSIASKTSSDLTASNLTVTAPAGYYASAATKTLSDENLVAGNIKKDVVIFGTTGTYEGSGGGGPSVDDVLGGNWPTGDIEVTLNAAPWLFGSGTNGQGNSNITQIVLTNMTEIPGSGIRNEHGVLKVIAQKVTKVNGAGIAYNNNLTHIDILGAANNSAIASLAFAQNGKLAVLIIRQTSAIVPCTQTNAFNGSMTTSKPINVYVPSALKSTYEAATNWSTWVAGGTIVFNKLEGSAYESTDWWE